MDRPEGTSLSEERLEILRMVETQQISVDDASRLLEALDRSDRTDRSQQPTGPIPFPNINFGSGFPGGVPQPPRRQSRNVRIRISDTGEKEAKINLVLPYRLLDSGLKMAKRFAPESLLEAQDIKESVEEGFQGHLLDITEGEQRIEIVVEGSATGDRRVDRDLRRAEAEIEREAIRSEREAMRAERDRMKEEARAEREVMKAERERLKEERRREREWAKSHGGRVRDEVEAALDEAEAQLDEAESVQDEVQAALDDAQAEREEALTEWKAGRAEA